MMASVELKNVNKYFGSAHVIRDLDLAIDDCKLTVLVGPSGSGKSTLLRLIAGLEQITSGDIFIDRIKVNDLEPAERGVAMVFQSSALYPHMTVERNIGFGLSMSGCPKAEVSARVQEVANILQLTSVLKHRPSELSGGQRQRVAIGRAIIRNPKVFLFDEPLSSLDAELRALMRVEIAKLHRLLGHTIVYVTHDQIEAMTLADKIVVVRDGTIEQVGTPLELYERPANIFVAGFIGSPKMNFFKGQIIDTPHGRRIRCLGGRVFGAAIPSTCSAGSAVDVGVRPEHFDWGGDGDITLSVIVNFVERLGATSYIHATVPFGETIVAEHRSPCDIYDGAALQIGISARRIHLFSAHGERLN